MCHNLLPSTVDSLQDNKKLWLVKKDKKKSGAIILSVNNSLRL